jgi:hypothetical protein
VIGGEVDEASKEDRELLDRFRPPFRFYSEYSREAVNLLSLSTSGIRRAVKVPAALKTLIRSEALTEDGSEWTEAQRRRLQEAEADAKLAQREIDEDFPLLFAHAVVGQWGAFEAMMDNFLLLWLRENPESLKEPESVKIRVSAADLTRLDHEQRTKLVLYELSKNLRVEFKLGVARFNELLDQLGLNVVADPAVRRDILEMQQVRHLWAHRGGICDAMFKDRCPWKETRLGERTKVTFEDFVRYMAATLEYNKGIYEKVLSHYDLVLVDGQLYRRTTKE